MTTAPLTSRPTPHVPTLIALGVFLWFIAAMTFRLLGEEVLSPGTVWTPVIFALSVPVAWLFVEVGKLLSGARGSAVFPAVTLMSATAMLLDGLALTFFPALYGLPTPSLLIVAAILLWGVGLILFIAYLQSRRRLDT